MADSDRQTQLLIEQLKELKAERHHLSPEQYEAEKSRLEGLAVKALREREKGKAAPPKTATGTPPSAPPPGFLAKRPQLKGALWGGGVVTFCAVLALLLYQNQKERAEGEVVTGRTPPMSAPASDEAADAEFQAALADVKSHPEKVGMVALVVHELIRRQQLDDAHMLTEKAIGVDPFHFENRVHRSFLRAARGEMKEAMDELDHLANLYPDSAEAVLLSGALALQADDKARALKSLERFLAESPQEMQLPEIKQSVAALRRELGRSP
jgi:tetratricopeptide (TPR) repeat protein